MIVLGMQISSDGNTSSLAGLKRWVSKYMALALDKRVPTGTYTGVVLCRVLRE